MMHRTLLCAGAALGLIAGGAAAQIGQQQQQRPGQVSPINGEDFLKDLEGEWNVEVQIFDIDAVEGVQMIPGLTYYQTQLQQLLVREGVDREDAQSKARELIQEIQRELPEQQALREKIQDALEDAGVSEERAQQEAQRLATEMHQQLRHRGLGQHLGQQQRPGLGQQPRPGIGQVDRDREVQYRGEGTATRSWAINETILQEQLSFTVEENGENNNNPQHRNGDARIDLRNGDEFEAVALFAFEPMNGDLCIAFADNTKSMLHYGIGQYDSADQAMVFHTINPERIQLPQETHRPGLRPMDRPGAGGPQVGQDGPGKQHRPGQQDRPGIGQERPGVGQQAGQQLRLEEDGARIVLRVVGEDEHVVEVYRSNPGGRATKIMELTYTRNNS